MSRARILLWTIPAAAYLVFCWWYTAWSGPLTEVEIDAYTATLAEHGAPPDRIAQLRQFMEQDTGRQFIMLNIIEMANPPRAVAGVAPDESADALLARYMEHMWPALLFRACHPIFAGDAVADALDVQGVAGAQHWSRGALMRYRSRRDMLDIVTNPAFLGRHAFKMAAMDKTIAFPVETVMYFSDPRVLLLLLILAAVAVVDGFMPRGSDRTR